MTAQTNAERAEMHRRRQEKLMRTRSSIWLTKAEHMETKALVAAMRDNKDYSYKSNKTKSPS